MKTFKMKAGSNKIKLFPSEPKITDSDSWWTGRNRIMTFASFTDAHLYWLKLMNDKVLTSDQKITELETRCKDKIAELEERCKKKEKDIADDKAAWNCLNHEKIYEEIRLLMGKKLALQWVLGEENNL
jgi:hypothetical protein